MKIWFLLSCCFIFLIARLKATEDFTDSRDESVKNAFPKGHHDHGHHKHDHHHHRHKKYHNDDEDEHRVYRHKGKNHFGHHDHKDKHHHHGHNHDHDENDVKKNPHANQKNKPSVNEFSPLKFLQKNGYHLGINSRSNLLAAALLSPDQKVFEENKELKEMISLFQRFYHLNVSGNLNAETVKFMQAPRCGFPDILTGPEENLPSGQPRLAAFKASQAKWNTTFLTYKFLNFNEELGETGTRIAIAKAFNYWANYTELNFQEVCKECPSNFVISFSNGDHGDGYKFDGQSGVLAHAFFPKDGRIHFDEAEHYTEDSDEGINLRMVAAHEIGHALGLEHSFEKKALMYAYYSGYVKNFELPEDDQLGIVSIYGKRKTPFNPQYTFSPKEYTRSPMETKKTIPTTTRAPSTTHFTTKITHSGPDYNPNKIPPCNSTIKLAFTSKRNNLFFLMDNNILWLYNVTSRNWITYSLFDIFPQIEIAVRGGAKCQKNLTWFFKEKKVWAFKDYDLVPGFPKRISDPLFPANPYTAVVKNGKFYVLKGSFAYLFDTTTLRIIGNQPEYMKKVFPGLPDYIESSLKFNGEHFMFKNKWVYKYDETLNKVTDGPRIKYESFFPCFKSKIDKLSIENTRKKLIKRKRFFSP